MSALAARVFGALVRLRNRGYDSGQLGIARLRHPVISIGNLAVGGRGKTPAVIAIGRELERRGISFDILTRGYRRRERKVMVALGGWASAEQVGDEAALLASRLNAPVAVHADRYRAGLEAERRFGFQVHLLDDGFQHRQLARNVDLVLIKASDLESKLLPAGRLREPPAALSRASAVVVLGDGRLDAEQAITTRIAQFSPAPVFFAWKRSSGGRIAGRRFAFCGIADPESFRRTVAATNVELCGWRTFRDHHWYKERDLENLREAARRAGAEGFVTTEKDAIRLGPNPGLEPLAALAIDLKITGLDQLMDLLLARCGLPQHALQGERDRAGD
jgi:tetraacyldisaccharide 4'-kinase